MIGHHQRRVRIQKSRDRRLTVSRDKNANRLLFGQLIGFQPGELQEVSAY